MLASFSIPNPADYALHSPRNFYSTAANQLGWSREQRAVLGRWSEDSRMPNRYDRSTCTTELQIRNDVAARIRGGWAPTGPFEVPSALPAPATGPTHALDADSQKSAAPRPAAGTAQPKRKAPRVASPPPEGPPGEALTH